MNNSDANAKYHLLNLLLPLIGYKIEPVTSLTLTYRHNRGTRIGITPTTIWYNK